MNHLRLIVGLGNTGKEYSHTRHNAGFMFLDFIDKSAIWRDEAKFKCSLAETVIAGQKVILAKPTTMMNNSGESVSLIRSYFKIENREILVVHDDMDIVLGSYKLQLGKGPKVHNGILSINEYLGSTDYYRLRIGIENRTAKGSKAIHGVDYALSNFSKQEVQQLYTAATNALAQITELIQGNTHASSQVK